MKHLYSSIQQRHKLQWVYASATLLVLLLGWKFPILGFMVVTAMIGGLISGVLAGRWFCGNLCPRGGFLERIVSLYSPGKKPPEFLKPAYVRIGFMLFMGTMLTINISRDPGNWRQWGLAFWIICLVTTAIGLILAIFWNARAWCQVCPMGTLQNWIGGDKYALAIDSQKCKNCRACEKACPMKLSIITKEENISPEVNFSNDCIRCEECVSACPVETLHFVDKQGHSVPQTLIKEKRKRSTKKIKGTYDHSP